MKYLKVWTSFREVIEPLQDAEKGRLFDMMLLYAEEGTDPGNFAGNERFVWPAAKQIIDLTAEKAEKLRQNGLKGGRPVTKDNQKEANESKNNQSEANESHKEKKRNNKEKEGNGKQSINIVPLKRFVPPTVDEIKEYCDRRGSWLIDPQAFIDYYEARGWMLNKDRKMVDWKAAVRTWENNERERKKKESYADLPY